MTDRDRASLLDLVPTGIFVMNEDLRVVEHNRTFGDWFGHATGRLCHQALRGSDETCVPCPARETFADGQERVTEHATDNHAGVGESHYLVRLNRILVDGMPMLAGMVTDTSATKRLQREFQTLFEQVPCFVAVINKNLRIVRANDACRRVFGEPQGHYCYELFHGAHAACQECPAKETFADGRCHSARQVGRFKSAGTIDHLVTTAPLGGEGKPPAHVIEIALDMTATRPIEAERSSMDLLREALVEDCPDAVVLVDAGMRLVLLNRAAERLWGYERAAVLGREISGDMIPVLFGKLLGADGDPYSRSEETVTTATGVQMPVRLVAWTLRHAGRLLGTAVIAQDLRQKGRHS
jgi:PAS domain S-box-containing protein